MTRSPFLLVALVAVVVLVAGMSGSRRLRAEFGHSRAMIRGLTQMRPDNTDALGR